MSILYYYIDEQTRELRPEVARKVVAQKDHNADVIRVGVPEALDSVDLETSAVRCMYQRPKETEVRSKTAAYYDTSGGYLWYDWTLQEGDTAKVGKINFSVCLQHVESGLLSVDWNTTIGEIHVKTSYHSDDGDSSDETITPTAIERISILESAVYRLKNISSGVPQAVGDISDMTDTTKIYVLSTDGKWYWHDGTEWVAGGTYGSAVTDTTLSISGAPADAEKVGDIFNENKTQFNDAEVLFNLSNNQIKNVLLARAGEIEDLSISYEHHTVTINGTVTEKHKVIEADSDMVVVPRNSVIPYRNGFSSGFFADNAAARKLPINPGRYKFVFNMLSGSITKAGVTYTNNNQFGSEDVVNAFLMKADAAAGTDFIVKTNVSTEVEIEATLLGLQCLYCYKGCSFDNAVFELYVEKVDDQTTALKEFERESLDAEHYELTPIERHSNTGLDAPIIGEVLNLKTVNHYAVYEFDVQELTSYKAVYQTASLTGIYGAITNSDGVILSLFGVKPNIAGLLHEEVFIPVGGIKVYLAASKTMALSQATALRLYQIIRSANLKRYSFPSLSFVQGGYNEDGSLSESDFRVSTSDLLVLPYGGKTKMTLNYDGDFIWGCRSGPAYSFRSNNQYWFTSGDSVIFKPDDNYVTITLTKKFGPWAKSNANNAIVPEDLTDANVIAKFEPIDIFGNHSKRAKAVSFKFNNSAENEPFGFPLIVHISDIHGDFFRVRRFLDFADKIEADAAVLSGDFVANNRTPILNTFNWLHEEIKTHKTLPVICPGNHDLKVSEFTSYTDDDVYNDLYAPIESEIKNTTSKTWYYTDVAGKNLRLISINLYQDGGSHRYRTHFTNEQLDWLCATLLSTPANYAIVIVYHAPQTTPAKTVGYEAFWQEVRKSANLATYSDVDGDPIADIVDAFIGRTTILKAYNQTGSPASVAASADFSSANAEFVCYLSGHTHQDGVYYVPNRDHLQLMLCITCATPVFGGANYKYLADCADLVRNTYDESMDAINVYGIDTRAKAVKIARVGADTVYDFSERCWMTIPYK